MRDSLFWFPMKPQDFLSRTAGLTPEARAAYVYLICHAWSAGKRGDPPASVPDDDAVLERLTGLGPGWARVRDELLPFFESADGRLVERDLLELWNTQLAAYQRRAGAGRKGGTARRTKQSGSKAPALLRHSESELEVKRSPFGGGALPPLRLEQDDQVEGATAAVDSRARVSTWERDHPDQASALIAQVAADLGIPLEKRATSRWVRAQFENLVMQRLHAQESKSLGNG